MLKRPKQSSSGRLITAHMPRLLIKNRTRRYDFFGEKKTVTYSSGASCLNEILFRPTLQECCVSLRLSESLGYRQF